MEQELDEFSEKNIYENWEKSGAFSCNPNSASQAYSIMIPPPNVTGNLHMGHALTMTIQDILIRWQRMKGLDVLWQPGTDHAGIATQMMVERQLAAENTNRKELGRSKFIEKVWQWKEKYGNNINNQLRELGSSLDWQRERFTLDKDFSNSVRHAFVKLYQDGLIYRDRRLVNWDPDLESAVSDLEINIKDTKNNLYYINYAIENSDQQIMIATTRPETILADSAIAVNPEDERYRNLIGKKGIIPLLEKSITIIADEYSNPEKGTGAVKITPAHDFNDFAVGQKHNLEMINILNKKAFIDLGEIKDLIKVNKDFIWSLDNQHFLSARKMIIDELTEKNYLVKIEDHTSPIAYAERSDSIIQPILTTQWFCDAKFLAKEAIAAVREGKIKFAPKQWENNFFAWMENIEPWCISRQLWWGHQIPAWYGPDGKIFVDETEEKVKIQARNHYGKEVELTQDEDVLDTWFSSGLWPFATLGWPNETQDFKRYYPTNVLVTGFDIIFFWVARMIMMGLHLTKNIPFETVFIHGLVCDEKGQKMSKTKGNVINPKDLIDNYGADALRWTISSLTGPGRNIKISEEKVKISRNFITKINNLANFFEMNQINSFNQKEFQAVNLNSPLSHWLLNKANILIGELDHYLENFRFDEASNSLYHFIWNIFCDWCVELSKPILQNNEKDADEIRQVMNKVFSVIVTILHPILPYNTEKLWYRLGYGGKCQLIKADWPKQIDFKISNEKIEEIEWVIKFVNIIRNLRAELNIAYNVRLEIFLAEASEETKNKLNNSQIYLKSLTKSSKIAILEENNLSSYVRSVINEATIFVSLQDVIDPKTEILRLEKNLVNLQAKLEKITMQLNNSDFVKNAPVEIIEEKRIAEIKLNEEIKKLREIMESLI